MEGTNIRALLARPEAERRIGPFRLVEQLGRGGFAPVWLAKETYGATELRAAAVKLFSLRDARDAAKKRGQIIEEARALCQVEHPNVVRFFALPIDDEAGVIALAMEHVAGVALDVRLRAERRLAVADVLQIGASVASALAAVHRAGLLHRDVKPANVIDAGGVYKLIDFGIAAADAPDSPAAAEARPGQGAEGARAHEPASEVVAKATERTTAALGGRWGTVGYVDPVCEAAAIEATVASDLYALGAMLFECITGRLPAARGEDGGVLRVEVLKGRARPEPVLDLSPETPPLLAALVDELVAPDRAARPQSAEWVATRLDQLAVELRGGRRALPPEEQGPFRGLGRFEGADRDVYFGRSGDIAATLHVLRERGLAAIVGPSGSGKSSLARAGVAPLVAEGALGWPSAWDVALCAPGSDPKRALLEALAPHVTLRDDTPAGILQALAERTQTRGRGLLLVVDQLEELATLAKARSIADASHAFASELLSRIGERPQLGVRALATLRRDMLDAIIAAGAVGRAVVRGSVLIEPIADAAWGDVLDQALSSYGYGFEDEGVKAEVLGQLRATADAMPLVQFALTELWLQRDVEAKRVTRAGLARLGGIAGALERHAEATRAALEPATRETTRAVLLALTTPSGTRRSATDGELARVSPHAEAIIDAFERARLVSRGEHGATLAHEAIIGQWPRLASWVAEARGDRLLAAELERDAERWRAEPLATPLWPRQRLAGGEELARRGVALSTDATAFLRASRRAARRGVVIAGSSAAVALGAIAIASVIYVQNGRQRLAEERDNRAAAERQTRQIVAKQAEIDRLLGALEDSRTKERIVALQREIRGDPAPVVVAAATTPLKPPPAPRPAAPPQPSARPDAPPSHDASQPALKVQKEW